LIKTSASKDHDSGRVASVTAIEALNTTRSGGHDTKHDTPLAGKQHLVELTCKRIGGPGRDRTDDLFHAIQHNSDRIIDIARNQGSEKALWEHFSRSRCALKCARVRAGWALVRLAPKSADENGKRVIFFIPGDPT
jgi:hypothetical protein